MIIDNDVLERACKDMIETILFCLNDTTKGTIYRVGPMPKLQAVRVTSGIRDEVTGDIRWGLPQKSDYNYPGKTWDQYRDRPGHPREAMAWCVERGKSWTADDPHCDERSVRKQVSNEPEDFHHMEPVLIGKSYLYGEGFHDLVYPVDYHGKPIWRDSQYVVVAVVKIHFKPGKIRRGDNSTKVIKKLSRTLGTQLLSVHARETLSKAQKELSRQRLQTCNVLAHELRNTLIKLGFTFSAINAEISFLREQWENQVALAFPTLDSKHDLLRRLDELILAGLPHLNNSPNLANLCETLINEQRELASLSLMPKLEERWIDNKIRPKWRRLLLESTAWDSCRNEIGSLLSRLRRAIWTGSDQELAEKVGHLPPELKTAWQRIAYTDFKMTNPGVLEEIIEFLGHPDLVIPHKQQTRKILTSLRALVEMIPEVEERANRIIFSLKNGSFE